MEYQKIANLLNDASNKPSKFRTRNWVEINDDIRGAYSPNKQIRFKTAMLRSSLCDYSDAYILVKGNITVNNNAGAGAAANNIGKKVILKNCAPFANCISKINNTQIDNAEYIDIVIAIKKDFYTKLSSLNRKITSTKTKYLLVENELKKLKTTDLGYFIGKSHFEEDAVQNCLVSEPLKRYFKVINNANTKYISSWQSKGLSDKTIKPHTTSDDKRNPKVNYYGTKIRLEFIRSCLKQDKSTINHGKMVNIYIVYELDKTYVQTNPTLVKCLFGAVSITKNIDIDKNKYSGYEIGFDRSGVYLLPDSSFGRNVLIFGVDMSSSCHVDDKEKGILIP